MIDLNNLDKDSSVVIVARKTWGYSNGYKTVKEFKEFFGINPASYPDLFRITSSGLVVKCRIHERICQMYFANVRHDLATLGIRN